MRKSLYGRVRSAGVGGGAVEVGLGARRLLVLVCVVAMFTAFQEEGCELR